MNGEKKIISSLTLNIILSVVVIILIGIIIAYCIGYGSTLGSGQQSTAESSQSATQDLSDSRITKDNETQKSAPSTERITSDLYGRQVIYPAGSDPAPLTTKIKESVDRCKISPQVTIQMASGAQTMWSENSGPTTLDHGVPTGYSSDVTGAALAAWNYRTMVYGGGELSNTVVHSYADFGDDQEEMLAHDFSEESENEVGFKILAPTAVRVLTCKKDFVVLEHLNRVYGDQDGVFETPIYTTFRFTMKLADNGWTLDVPAMAQGNETIRSLDGWTQWQY